MLNELADPVQIHRANNSQFQYYEKSLALITPGYVPRYEHMNISFAEWLAEAIDLDNDYSAYAAEHGDDALFPQEMEKPHSYIQPSKTPKFVNRDLPTFRNQRNTFFSPHHDSKSLNCRFGQSGTLTELHYDTSRNFVAVFRGLKRYVLLPPEEYDHLHIHDSICHPHKRHSLCDLRNPKNLDPATSTCPNIFKAKALQKVLKPGEVLYIPSHWFHYVLTLDKNMQCNIRSGKGNRGNFILEKFDRTCVAELAERAKGKVQELGLDQKQ
jgi:hypothetical protein